MALGQAQSRYRNPLLICTALFLCSEPPTRCDTTVMFALIFSIAICRPAAKLGSTAGGGIIFLLPLCVYFFISSWGFVQQSWEFREISSEPGGIPAVFLLKTLIPLMAVNLGLQAFAETLRNLLILIAREDSVQL